MFNCYSHSFQRLFAMYCCDNRYKLLLIFLLQSLDEDSQIQAYLVCKYFLSLVLKNNFNIVTNPVNKVILVCNKEKFKF